MSEPASLATDRCARWRGVRRLLAVRLDNLGDVLMCTPALAALREGLPHAHIALLASPAGAALAPHLPMVDEAIAFDAPWVKGGGVPRALDGAELRLVERLRKERYDAAVVFTSCTQSALPAALLLRLAGVALALAHCRENPYALLSDWLPETDAIGDGMRHEVERQLALVAAVGFAPRDDRLAFALDAADTARVRAQLGGTGSGVYFVVHVGASATSRRYPAARFGAAAERIARETGRLAVYTGDAGERELVAQARQAMTRPSRSLAGELTLGELGALIAGADLLVANNTGPVHLAAALGVPVVDLYALTNPQHTPWRVPSRVLNRDVPCRHCLKSVCPAGHHECLLGVAPQAVADAALALLAATPGERRAA